MKIFPCSHLKTALDYAATGEVAIHLHWIVFLTSPACFRREVKNGYPIAHMFSSDKELITEIAVRSGIKKIYIHHEDTPRQHIDVCGTPLRSIFAEMGEDFEKYRRVVR